MYLSVIAEYCACAYILILLIGTISEQNPYTQQDRSFYLSLIVSLLAILSDIATVHAAYADTAYLQLAWLNTVNFLLTLLTVTAIAGDVSSLLFEDRTQTRRYRLLRFALGLLYAVALIVTLVAIQTGRILPSEHYSQTFAAWLPFWFMAANMVVIVVVFVLERAHVRRAFTRVGVLLPLLIIASMVAQSLLREIRLAGTLSALTLTVLFIYGQQQKLYTDHLTTLVSREMFYKTLEKFSGSGVLFHVIVISLRDYKSVNVRFGQRVGDEFLRLVGAWISKLEKSAVACRFSGVEFALIVQDSRVDDYERLIDAICARFTKPWEHAPYSLMLRAAVVDIAWPEHASTVNELISSLEYAVRLAKSAESGGLVRFDKQLRNQVGRRGYVIAQLERALHEERYFIHFQPIYDCRQKRMVGAEVLCRMRDESGVIMPGEFIPLAEEAELVREIDRQVLAMACAFYNANHGCGLDWISVNISGMEYQTAQMQEWFYGLLKKECIPDGAIRLEITERMLIDDMDGACTAIEQLRAHGVGFCLDDFGVGYSNLFSVVRMDLDCVKIDKSLVDHIATDKRARDMLRAVVDGLRELDTRILAEGVETGQQQQIIEEMGVDYVQGYYHARPMDGDALLAFLAERRDFMQ